MVLRLHSIQILSIDSHMISKHQPSADMINKYLKLINERLLSVEVFRLPKYQSVPAVLMTLKSAMLILIRHIIMDSRTLT